MLEINLSKHVEPGMLTLWEPHCEQLLYVSVEGLYCFQNVYSLQTTCDRKRILLGGYRWQTLGKFIEMARSTTLQIFSSIVALPPQVSDIIKPYQQDA